MKRRITVAALILIATACSSNRVRIRKAKGSALSYAQYHALEQGLTAKAVVNSFGTPVDSLQQDGRVRGLTYWCEDAAGQLNELRMVFSADERLEQWALKAIGTKPKKSGSS